MPIASFIILVLLAFLMETVDSGLGMGYGTVLSPFLIIFGYPPLIVVPAILFSQAVGGLTASFFHHKYGTVDFKAKLTNMQQIRGSLKNFGFLKSFKICFSRDFKIAFVVTVFGIAASITGAFMAVKASKVLLKTYIGILVLIMGVLILLKTKFGFSWKRIFGIAIISAFNKGLSGGGFGPIITGGQIISGNKPSSSIGSTTLAEVPICIVGFLTYLLTRGLASYSLLVALSIGALIGGICGPVITKVVDSKKLKYILGILIIAEGIAVLLQVVTKKSFGG